MSRKMLRCYIWLLWLLSPALATGAESSKPAGGSGTKEIPAAPAAKAPASATDAMAASIELQRASVRTQAGAAATEAGSFFTVPWPAPPPAPRQDAGCAPMPDSELDPLVAEAARANQLQPELIRAVIRQESASRACAVSEKGALGLMQLMPAVVEQFAVRDPFDPKENVAAGTKLLKQLMTRFKGDLRLALGAYNAGAATVPEDGTLPDIPETRKYVQAILDSLGKH